MEYVDGVDLLRYVRGYAGEDDDTAERVEFTETMAARTVNPMARAANPIRAPWQLHRLRDTVGQIAEGLDTIHRARKLRDLKPSNILVTPEGRAVILDFGLMSGTSSYSPGSPVAGTMAYMSPEQSIGEQLTPASDWYSVGTIAYEALTGVLPFSGDFSEVMRSRLNDAPAPVLQAAPWLSPAWERLTSRLLNRDRNMRWTAREVLEWAGRDAAITTAPADPPFVGRDDELRELVRAFNETRGGKPACVFLRGDSGVGKSELVHHAARMMYDADPGAVFLSGRCYEQEEVPFKAVDGLVDRLSDYLRGLPEREAARVLPTDTPAPWRACSPCCGNARRYAISALRARKASAIVKRGAARSSHCGSCWCA